MGHARDHAPSDPRMANARGRIARAHGHLHAVLDMVDDGRDPAEVLQQLAAVRAALDKATAVMLDALIQQAQDAPRGAARAKLETLRAAVKTLA